MHAGSSVRHGIASWPSAKIAYAYSYPPSGFLLGGLEGTATRRLAQRTFRLEAKLCLCTCEVDGSSGQNIQAIMGFINHRVTCSKRFLFSKDRVNSAGASACAKRERIGLRNYSQALTGREVNSPTLSPFSACHAG